MHNRRPLRIASTIGPVETRLLPALEAAYSRRGALPVEHDALGTAAALERAKRGGFDLVIAHAPALEEQFVAGGATAREAAAQDAYSLLDRATFVTARPALEIMVEGDPRLLNVLSALPVNPRRAAEVNEGGAEAFLDWLLGDEAQALIGDFGRAEHGTSLFMRRDQIPSQPT